MKGVILPVGIGIILLIAGQLYRRLAFKAWFRSTRIDKRPEKMQNVCPLCGSDMVIRVVPVGKHKGKEVLVCKRWPECRKVRWEELK